MLNSFGLDLQDPKNYLVFDKEMKVLYDKEEKFTISNLPLDQFYSTNNRALGYQKGSVWSKLEIPQILYGKWLFINPKTNTNIVDVYIFEEDKLVDIKKIGNYRSPSNNTIKSKFNNFELEIKPNKKYTIISKLQSKGPIDVSWIASREDVFITYNLYDILFWGIFGGFILSLIVYNTVAFLSLKDFTYVAYTFHALFALFFQLATNGIFYQFELYENLKLFNSISWIMAQLSLLSILYFAMFFLNTKKQIPFAHTIIITLFGVVSFMMILFLYSFLNPEVINYVRQFTKIISLSILFFVFVLAIYGVKQQIQGAKYYLLGHGFFILAIIYQQFGGIINNETSLISIYLVAVSILFDILFLSLALSQRVAFLKYEKEKNERLLIS